VPPPPLAPDVVATTTASARPQGALPTGKGIGVIGAKVNRTQQAVDYHGGRVMSGASNLYFIWYGDWARRTVAQSVLTNFGTQIGGSRYFQINALYHDANGAAPSGDIVFGGSAYDAYSRGEFLSDDDVAGVVGGAIASAQLPQDVRGIYVVFTSPDVVETSGFGTSYCGFHGSALVMGLTLRFAFVGDPGGVSAKCAPQANSPNDDESADAMASVLAAEMSNVLTDPEFTAWYDRNALEPADKCAWTYGTTYTTANGARANVHLGLRDYLLQQLWVPGKKGGCALAAP
jgi:hypothetical protein